MDGYMDVVIVLQNSRHAEALARRLVQLTDRIRITVEDADDEDKSRKRGTEAEGTDDSVLLVDDNLAAACSSASLLLTRLKEQYLTRTGRRLCCAADEGPIIIGVGSAAGGSGTTAAAVTLARLMAGKLKGETALIFAGGSGNPMIYIEKTHENSSVEHKSKTPRELDYMLTHNIETEMSGYIISDRYGPLAAVSAADPRLLLERLRTSYNVEAAVLDMGSGGRTADCHIYIETAACGDLRAAAFEEGAAAEAAAENKIFLLNKAAARDRRGRLFCLPHDPDSFRLVEKQQKEQKGINIEILMDGLYSSAMRPVAEEIREMMSSVR